MGFDLLFAHGIKYVVLMLKITKKMFQAGFVELSTISRDFPSFVSSKYYLGLRTIGLKKLIRKSSSNKF